MFLRRLELQGFKSFADKINIELEQDITAVVGPNGSGKSNITDSIRWLLGEREARNLRGGKAEDLIFAGTSSTTVSMPANAEMAIINACFNSWTNITTEGSKTQFMIRRSGVNSASIWTGGGSAGQTAMTQKLSASLSANIITLTVTNGNGTSLSGTAYFYSN